jgi:HEAT repeat protein
MVATRIGLVLLLTAGAPDGGSGGDAGTRGATGGRADVEAGLRKTGRDGDAELHKLAAGQELLLMAIAEDPTADELLRSRALAALAYAHSGRVHAFLENFIIRKTPSSAPVDRTLLRRAAIALGWQAGPRVVDTLAPLLDHPDRDVRLDAAVALGMSRERGAEKPLRAHLGEEQDPAVKRQIEAALRSVAPAAAPH